MIALIPEEMNKLWKWWTQHTLEPHGCDHKGTLTIKHYPGGGIGTVTKAKCGCGKEIDITDYESW